VGYDAGVGDAPATPLTSGDREPGAARVARLFASPGAVLVILPALVVAAGVTVLLLGRAATRDTAENMARSQFVAMAAAVKNDIESAVEQADPVFKMMGSIANEAMPTNEALTRLHDIVVGRPVTNASIVFPVGVMWQTFRDKDSPKVTRVQETKVGPTETTRTSYSVVEGDTVPFRDVELSAYDPRTRPYYLEAVKKKGRVWLPPRVFSSSGKTGVTVAEPVVTDAGEVAAVLVLDYDAAELSELISTQSLPGARSVVFTKDGTILAYPSRTMPEAAIKEKRLIRHTDFKDPALDALFAALGTATRAEQAFMHLDARGDKYLASVSAIGGKTGAVDWYLATLVPKSTLFATMKRLNRDSLIASGGALAIAIGVALMFAWNILRMRRTVAVARAAARSAEERAKELGSYRLVERLGAGGMGEVWRAEHQLLARKAAIKLVRPDVLRDPSAAPLIQERFRREAQTLASMRSRHTIELYDYGVTDDGTFFYVMELLDGLDLSELVRKDGPQPAARVVSIISQACQSLAEAHDAGLLHRDIKPANLELCRAADEVDIVKVLDFGIVHNIADPLPPTPLKPGAFKPPQSESGPRLTQQGVVIGTPGYIPPEQAVAAPLDPRGDLYALGCVAWYLLTGTEVYARTSEDEVLRAHVYDAIPNLRERVTGWLPVELERLVVQCLAKRPEERPEDARTLARALDAIEIPMEHAWTDVEAQLWWSKLTRTQEQKTAAETARMLVPQRATVMEAEAAAAGSAPPDARTVEARRSARTIS
jgi:serine/threonine protein kinase